MMSLAFGPTSCSSGLVPKSTLLHNPEVQYSFVPKHSLHGGKNIALRAEKPFLAQCAAFLVKRSVTVFLPLKMSYVAKQRVVMSWLCVGACSQAQSHDSGTEARRAKTSSEGFFNVFVKNRNLN